MGKMSFRMALGSSPVREIMIGVTTQSFFIICSLMSYNVYAYSLSYRGMKKGTLSPIS